MNKYLIVVLLVVCLSSLTMPNYAKNKDYNKFKNGLEVELKYLSGKEVNKLLSVTDAHPSTAYVYGYIRNKFKGRVFMQIRINVRRIENEESSGYNLDVSLPFGKERFKNYFLIYLGEQGIGERELSYDILWCSFKGSRELCE